jgi:hypothetical protein
MKEEGLKNTFKFITYISYFKKETDQNYFYVRVFFSVLG